MGFDILGFLFVILAVLFLVGGAGGTVLYKENPQLNITEYANERVMNMTMNNSINETVAAKYNQSGRIGIATLAGMQFVMVLGYQSIAAGIEYGFNTNWVPPELFALIALFLLVYTMLGSGVLFPIAIVIIIKDWVSERFLKRGVEHSKVDSKGKEF